MTNIKDLTDIEVGDVMTTRLVTTMADDTVQEVAALMLENDFSTIPVVNSSEQCVGILSRKDLTEMFLQEDQELSRLLDTDRLSMEWLSRSTETSELRKVHELMNVNITTILRTAKLPAVCQTMSKHKVHHLPVIDENETLVGMVSTFDVINAIADLTGEG